MKEPALEGRCTVVLSSWDDASSENCRELPYVVMC